MDRNMVDSMEITKKKTVQLRRKKLGLIEFSFTIK